LIRIRLVIVPLPAVLVELSVGYVLQWRGDDEVVR